MSTFEDYLWPRVNNMGEGECLMLYRVVKMIA